MPTAHNKYSGNILSLSRLGVMAGQSGVIDSLHYEYRTQGGYNYTNKLESVTDRSNNTLNLGDFKDNESTGDNDYLYDDNGSLTRDNNKYITDIKYNQLNLPTRMDIADHEGVKDGVIKYQYDALGNRQVKTVTETVDSVSCKTTTYYLGELVYEKREGYPGADGTTRLLFISNEEGRAVYDTANEAFHYQYLIRDHLGNTRMLLNAEEQPQQSYPNCDFEDDHATENETYYVNAGPESYLITPPPGFNTSEGTGAKCQLIKNNEAPVGVGKLLKVMATDEVGVKLDYYIPTDAVDNTGSDPLRNLIESIIGILNNTGYSGAMHGGGTAVGGGFEHDATLNSLLYPQSASNPSPNTVKAYLNILFFDDGFNFVCAQSRYVQLSVMGTAQTVTILGSSMIAAPANGYAYIYVSNESRNAVFIDNFQVVHRPGRIVQDVSYYPFGMTMAGISSGAANSVENKIKYNGKEEQRQEFSNGSGLELYDFGARMQDPQLGRWWTIDPKADLMRRYSPYNYAFDNPLRFIDPDGMAPSPPDVIYKDKDGNEIGRVETNAAYDEIYTVLKGSVIFEKDKNGKNIGSGFTEGSEYTVKNVNHVAKVDKGFSNTSEYTATTTSGSAKYSTTINDRSSIEPTAEKVKAVIEPLALASTATAATETLAKNVVTEAKFIEQVGEKTATNFGRFAKGMSVLDIGASIANYSAGNISGAHATVNIGMAVIGSFFPAVSLAWGLIDTFAGEMIFNDHK